MEKVEIADGSNTKDPGGSEAGFENILNTPPSVTSSLNFDTVNEVIESCCSHSDQD